MNLKQLHTTLLLTLCAALSACSEQDALVDNSLDGKTPIELSVGGVDAPALTRAVITTDPYNPLNYFDQTNATKVFMIMKSTYGTADYEGSHDAKYTVARGDVAANSNKVDFDTNNKRYWDDAHARSSQLNIWAYAQIGMSTWNQCTFQKDAAGGGYEAETWTTTGSYGWRTAPVYPFIATWSASRWADDHQDASSVMCQDLLFSNNLVDNSATGTNLDGSDNALKFNFTTRKFPQEGEAQMKFYRAMSKITIKIIEGDGFNKSATTDFQFTPSTSNVKLTGFNTKGLFSIQQGVFQEISQQNEIPSIYLKTTNTSADPYYTLEALAIPNIDEIMQSWTTPLHDDFSRFVSGKKDYATDVMMEFTIDNNKYQITSGQLYDALHVDGDPTKGLVTNATKKTNNGTYIPMEAGKNYVFTFTVGKQKIKNITAQVADWENVDAEPFNPTNARIKLQLEERGTAQTSDVAFYKANDNKTTDGIDDDYTTWNWKTGYTNLGATYSSDHWTTNSFWESNKDFYHFRALMPASTAVTPESTDGDFVTLTSGNSYTDVRWGAPMLDDGDNTANGSFKWLYGPTSNGFDAKDDGTIASGLTGAHQIYKAIGPTEDPVKLILFHMMSDLTINVTTTTGTDAVNLGDGSSSKTKVELVNYKTGGKVLLGNGLVKATGNAATAEIAQNTFTAATGSAAAKAKYVYGAIPQDLTNVVLVITTPDHNQYKVAMKDVKATTISTNNIANPYQLTNGKYTIDRWYPGFKYTYSFTLAKTGITNLQATIVDWETVTADDETVKIQ